MKPFKRFFILHSSFFISMLALMISCSQQSMDRHVDKLYDRMSQEERVAQLHGVYLNEFITSDGKLDEEKCARLLPYGAGHFSQFCMGSHMAPDSLRDVVMQMQRWLQKNTPCGIPAMFHEEALSGVNALESTIYPQQIGQACSFNTKLAEEKTWQTAVAMRQMGATLALSPMVDVVRDPSFNRLEESYGEDAYLGAAMGTAFVRGLQHGNLREGVAACSKHFLGYGGGGNADKKELMEEILLPHETMIRTAGSRVVMTGYHSVDGIKCVANRQLQEGILRDYLHFDGLMVSDYSSIDQIDDNISTLERAAAAMNAGNDVDFPKGNSYRHLLEALDKGMITQQALEKAVKRVLRLKAQVGLLDKKKKFDDDAHVVLDTKAERETAYRIATQSVVLLKNDVLSDADGQRILPLAKGKIARNAHGNAENARVFLTGPNANTMWAMCGDYSYPAMRYFWKQSIEDGMHPKVVGLKEGMENRLPEGVTLTYSRGCNWTDSVETVIEKAGDPRTASLRNKQNRMMPHNETADWDRAMRMAAESDVIVAAMGENAILCGENRDRTHLRLPGRQEEYVRQLIATGKPVVLVIFGGRAQVLGDLADRCAAIIQAWYPGEEGGNAVADILYGNVVPSGKLSVSYPSKELHEPICYNNGLEGDERIQWPFGYGLSYASFEYSNLQMSNEMPTSAEAIDVTFSIKNTGDVDAEEIAQIYVSPLDGSSAKASGAAAKLKPIALQGFTRLALKAGETKTITMTLSPQQLGYYVDGHWAIDPGRYIIKVGASSADIRLQREIVLTGDQHTMPLRTKYFAE